MSSIQLDDDGDIVLTKNKTVIIDGLAAIRQHLWVRTHFFLGEWQFDTSLGVPWFRDILVKQTTFLVIKQIFQEVILNTPGVLRLLNFDMDYSSAGRSVTITFAAQCAGGVIDFSEEIGV